MAIITRFLKALCVSSMRAEYVGVVDDGGHGSSLEQSLPHILSPSSHFLAIWGSECGSRIIVASHEMEVGTLSLRAGS